MGYRKYLNFAAVLILAVLLTLACSSGKLDRKPINEENSYYASCWAVGHWVCYEYYVAGLYSTVHIKIIGKEDIDGVENFTIEIVQKQGMTTTATSYVIPYSESDPFLNAEKGHLPGVNSTFVSSTGRDLAPNKFEPGNQINIQALFGGGANATITRSETETNYTMKSSKEIVCIVGKCKVGGRSSRTLLFNEDVPITRLAKSEGDGAILDLIDFGYSGARSSYLE